MTTSPTKPAEPESRVGIADTLKSGTWDLHQTAENGHFQKRLVKGELGRGEYAALLAQLLVVHRALEASIEHAGRHCERVRSLNEDQPTHSPRLEQDLSTLGVEPATVRPVSAAEDFASWLNATAHKNPTAVIGPQYVLEGSTNGNRFIARAIGPALGLEGDGLRYLESYGDEQRECWGRFRSRLDRLDLDADALDGIVAAARRTFEGIHAINTQLLDQLSGRTPSA
ncbi:MAG: biliverdin-producing heme oxygenase [Planctomycetota bacterium]